jgi:SAM-dependent methyltransferase
VDYASIDCDVKHDLTKFPYPFKDESALVIECNAVLEHLPIPVQKGLIDECHRILKKDGVLIIRVPHFTSHIAWGSIEHVKGYSIFTFDSYQIKKLEHSQSDYMHDKKWKSVKAKIVFGKKYQIWNYPLEWLANKYPNLYESSFLRVFPAEGVHVKMTK